MLGLELLQSLVGLTELRIKIFELRFLGLNRLLPVDGLASVTAGDLGGNRISLLLNQVLQCAYTIKLKQFIQGS